MGTKTKFKNYLTHEVGVMGAAQQERRDIIALCRKIGAPPRVQDRALAFHKELEAASSMSDQELRESLTAFTKTGPEGFRRARVFCDALEAAGLMEDVHHD